MGLGWWLDKRNNNIMMHSGNTLCFSSFLGINKEKKISVVLLSNYPLRDAAEIVIGKLLLNDVEKNLS